MNILADYHHSDLWWSHYLIFEVALGHKLYRPRGMEWFERGYYYQSAPDVARQFLVNSLFAADEVSEYPLVPAALLGKAVASGMRLTPDALRGCPHYPLMRTLSLEEFANTPIDVIMPTISNNQEPWSRLRRDLKPAAKLLREEGNINGWATLHPDYQNVLTSDLKTFRYAEVRNKVLYHQRFDTKAVYTYSAPTVMGRVTCFMPGFRGCPELVAFAERHDFGGMEFLDYGHHSKLGFLSPKERFVEAMRQTTFVWHVKPGGDGFGHVVHNSIAMGRPIITVADDYRDGLAWPLLLDGETCILIGRDPVENSRKIKRMSHPERIKAMSQNAASRFKEIVNYDLEAERIRAFLERLV